MKLTAEQLQKADNWLKEHIKHACPACGFRHFAINSHSTHRAAFRAEKEVDETLRKIQQPPGEETR
jgi:hypothetical protein